MYMFFDGLDRPIEGYYKDNVNDYLANSNYKYAKKIKYDQDNKMYFDEQIDNDNYNEVDFKDEVKENKKSEIKKKTNEVILSKYSDWKQRNMTAYFMELLYELIQEITTELNITDMKKTEKDNLQSVWEWVKSIREQSDTMESDIEALDLQGINDYEINFNLGE